MPLIRHPLVLACVAGALASPSAGAAVTEDFSTYRVGEGFSTGETLGSEDQGWLGGWRTSSSHVTTTARVETTAPVDVGPYLGATINSSDGQTSRPSGAISRPYAPPEEPFTLTFRFRPALVDSNLRYFLFDNDARAAGPGRTSSWQIETVNGQWRLIDGAGNGGSENYIDTGFPITAGATYAFSLAIDPVKRVWSVTISDGQKTVAYEQLNFRTDAFTTERWIHFGAGQLQDSGPALNADWSIDSISLRP